MWSRRLGQGRQTVVAASLSVLTVTMKRHHAFEEGARLGCEEPTRRSKQLKANPEVKSPFTGLKVGAWRIDTSRLPALAGLDNTEASAHVFEEAQQQDVKDVKGPTATAALSQVVAVLNRFFTEVSPDLPKALGGFGILLMSDVLKPSTSQEPRGMCQPVKQETAHDRQHLLEQAERYMRIASAVYGPLLVNPVMFPDSMELRQAMSQGIEAALRAHAGFQGLDVDILCDQHEAGWLTPAHVVAWNRQTKELIIAIRGTLSVEDVITDLGAEDVPFFGGGIAHASILQSAGNVLRCISPALHRVAPEVEKVTFTGHSLGAATAVYLSWLFAELCTCEAEAASEERARDLEVQCFAFGSPGVFSAEVARAVGDSIISFSNGHDIVPRLSFGSVVELHNRAIVAAESAKVPWQPVQEPAPGAGKSGSGQAQSRPKLYPAGRNFLISYDGQCKEVDPEDAAPFIWLGGGARLVFDHLPPQYEASLKAARQAAPSHPP